MSAPRCLRFGLLALCLSIAMSAYAGSSAIQPTGIGGERDPLVAGGASDLNDARSIRTQFNSSSSLSGGLAGVPGSKYAGNGLSGGGELKPIDPPLPPVPVPVPEPDVLLDLGMALAAAVTLWKFQLRRSA